MPRSAAAACSSLPALVEEALNRDADLHSSYRVVQQSRLTSLWAGYGTIIELRVKRTADGSEQQLILKQVNPPADEGVSHERKVKSYQVEACFYNEPAPALLQAGHCPIATPLHVACDLGPSGGSMQLLLTDLRPSYPHNAGRMSLTQCRTALTWLAGFHAHFWEQPTPAGLWEEGSYWHLDTRWDEYDAIGPEWADLKAAAKDIDRRLRGFDSSGQRSLKHRTVVHGDFKTANVLFSPDGLRCAVYDFQYCGGGLGMRDVAYLMCSSVDSKVVQQHETELLRHYHDTLSSLLPKGVDYSFQVMQEHFGLCVADFVRFMAGWGRWGNSSWADRKTRAVLASLQPQGAL